MNENIAIVNASMDNALYTQLNQRLGQMQFSFDDWLDKVTRQYLHLPPKFSYAKPDPVIPSSSSLSDPLSH